MKVFITSDHHFGHENLARKRGFDSAQVMNDLMVERWNNAVSSVDTVWVLGDFCWGNTKPSDVVERLNGRFIYFLEGNHDEAKLRTFAQSTGRTHYAGHYATFKDSRTRFILFHYPIESWDRMHHGSVHLHGHTHQKEAITGRNRINVAVEAWNFRPAPLPSVVAAASASKVLFPEEGR